MGEEIERDYLLEKNRMKPTTEEERNLNEEKNSNVNEEFDLKIKIKILLIQNLGIILGFSLMLIMALFSENINL